MACKNNDNDTFVHSSSNVKFNKRNDAIFGGLSGLEEKYDKEVPKDDPFAETYAKKGKPRRPHKVPDHVLHPEKWTKYSLEEDGTSAVSTGQTGDALNREIAMNFITELKNRKAKETEKREDEKMETCVGEQLNNQTGLKRKIDQINDDDEEALTDKTSGNIRSVVKSGAATVMKTYEFGKKQSRKSNLHPKVDKAEGSEVELNLSHLSDVVIETQEKSSDNERINETKAKFNAVRKAKKNLRKSELTDDD